MHFLKQKAGGASVHVGTGAPARPVEQRSTAVSFAAGCPILARFVRKSGIPQARARWDFLRKPSCPSWFKVLFATTTIAGCPILARFVRKSGIPQARAQWDFLRKPSC